VLALCYSFITVLPSSSVGNSYADSIDEPTWTPEACNFKYIASRNGDCSVQNQGCRDERDRVPVLLWHIHCSSNDALEGLKSFKVPSHHTSDHELSYTVTGLVTFSRSPVVCHSTNSVYLERSGSQVGLEDGVLGEKSLRLLRGH